MDNQDRMPPGDEDYPAYPHDDGDETGDTPASVVFMEMMRRAAAGNSAERAENVQQIASEEGETPLAAEQGRSARGMPMDAESRRQAAAMQAQRIERLQRRRDRRRQKRAGTIGGFLLTWFIVIVSGGLIATILSWGTSPESLSPELRAAMGDAQTNNQVAAGITTPSAGVAVPTNQPTPNYMIQIGIVSGHMGPEGDPGAVCPDGLTESEINFAVADRVRRILYQRGYEVDLLEEFDSRLQDYRANLLLSIHSNDCRDYGEPVSGFLVSKQEARSDQGPDARLVECIAQEYGEATGLERRYGLTRDMNDYHIFREIHASTPGAIIELGFMRDDREMLTGQPDMLAQALVEGITCFLNAQSGQATTGNTQTPSTSTPTPPVSPGA